MLYGSSLKLALVVLSYLLGDNLKEAINKLMHSLQLCNVTEDEQLAQPLSLAAQGIKG